MAEEFNEHIVNDRLRKPIFGIPVFSGNLVEAQSILRAWLNDKKAQARIVVTPNPEQIMLAQKNLEFNNALKNADLSLPDGIGLVIAGRLLSELDGKSWSKQGKAAPFPERLPGRILFEWLVKESASAGMRVLLIGGYGMVSRQAAERLQKRYPGLEINSIAGPTDALHPTTLEERLVEEKITAYKPHVLGVAFGAPKQELWLISHKDMLRKNGVKIAMAIGGTLDILAGRLQSVPKSIEQAHLEWLFRLLQEPSRWRRQLALPAFAFKVIRARFFSQQ